MLHLVGNSSAFSAANSLHISIAGKSYPVSRCLITFMMEVLRNIQGRKTSYITATARKPPIVFFCLKEHSWTIKVSQELNVAPAMIFLQYLLYNI